MSSLPRLLIEEWLPAAAIGVECFRERSTGQQPPDKRLHVWWARRPLAVSRAAVLGSLLHADFPREVFERLLGFWGPSARIIKAQEALEWARENHQRLPNPHGQRAFRNRLGKEDLKKAHKAAATLWGDEVMVMDPMAEGGSIPLEASRLWIRTIANEYNPVACLVLETTVDYPFRFGEKLASRAHHWAAIWRERFNQRVNQFFPAKDKIPRLCYIFARSVPCPFTGHETPLVPDWHLLKPKGGGGVVAVPVADKTKGSWSIEVKGMGPGRDQLKKAPTPTYKGGKGVSLFTELQIPSDYIKTMAQQGRMGSRLYAVVVKTPQGLRFEPPTPTDLQAMAEAEGELAHILPGWEKRNILPNEQFPENGSDLRPRLYGMPRWMDMFSPRQLLVNGVLAEELLRLRPEIVQVEGPELGEGVEHLLANVLDKLINYNCLFSSWHAPHSVMRSLFDRHDYSFKPSFAEMSPCSDGAGLSWAINSVLEAYKQLAKLPRAIKARPAEITLGSAVSLPHLEDGSITAVVVDPPYADNVQYAELADFFYVG